MLVLGTPPAVIQATALAIPLTASVIATVTHVVTAAQIRLTFAVIVRV